ncbi:MAG: cytochrome c3 family protein [Nitrospinota bacterium]
MRREFSETCDLARLRQMRPPSGTSGSGPRGCPRRTRRAPSLPLAISGILILALLTGCGPESRKKVLSTFFDGVGPPPPTRRVRRDLLREIQELQQELAKARKELVAAREAAKGAKLGAPSERAALPAEEAKTWPEAAKLLPKDQAGRVDWIEALKAKAIAPRPGLDPNAPEQAVLELDVELASSPAKLYAATFSHGAHTRWLTCGNCHPSIFPLGRGAEPAVVTLAKIQAGQFCGVCHGKVAFGVEGNCARCHTAAAIPARADWRPSEEPRNPLERTKTWAEAVKLLPEDRAGGVDWAKALEDKVIAPRAGLDPKAPEQPVLPIDVEMVSSGNPAFKAVFPHKAHTAWLACPNCHPAIFQMARGANPTTMAKIYAGESCGRCHGKVAFAVPPNCGRCHPLLAGK